LRFILDKAADYQLFSNVAIDLEHRTASGVDQRQRSVIEPRSEQVSLRGCRCELTQNLDGFGRYHSTILARPLEP